MIAQDKEQPGTKVLSTLETKDGQIIPIMGNYIVCPSEERHYINVKGQVIDTIDRLVMFSGEDVGAFYHAMALSADGIRVMLTVDEITPDAVKTISHASVEFLDNSKVQGTDEILVKLIDL